MPSVHSVGAGWEAGIDWGGAGNLAAEGGPAPVQEVAPSPLQRLRAPQQPFALPLPEAYQLPVLPNICLV